MSTSSLISHRMLVTAVAQECRAPRMEPAPRIRPMRDPLAEFEVIEPTDWTDIQTQRLPQPPTEQMQ